jgi:hypothetical protein
MPQYNMRYTTIIAFVVAVTAAPLPKPQIGDLLDNIPVASDLPVVGDILSGVGNLVDGILGSLGGILDLPLGIVGDIADRLDPRERTAVVAALAEIKNVIQPHVSDATVAKRDPQRSLGSALGGSIGNLLGGVVGTLGDLVGK